ncbi:hypothetical protein [uncultured Fusobacterium sp.]|uniref:hypothetical protein n=1 Tax=uncultured Fusobacterium sp. TaxID=159267 RepID=UPI0015A6A2FB|nr:hypothetical protein [uncultured Fusobacterium sp.]
MAYFDRIKNLFINEGVENDPLARDLGVMAFYHLIMFAHYPKDYLQVVEFEKLENNILKMIIKQENVNEKIREHREEIILDNIEEEILEKFEAEKMYIIEDEEYNGITRQTILFASEY